MIERCYFKFSVGALGVLSRLALIGCQPSPWRGVGEPPPQRLIHTRARDFTDRERSRLTRPPTDKIRPFFFFLSIEIRDEDSCPSRGEIQNALHSHNRDLLIRQPPKISTLPRHPAETRSITRALLRVLAQKCLTATRAISYFSYNYKAFYSEK